MPLPINAVPQYEILLPLSQTKVVYRPFLVKEEKLLLLAAESKDEKMIFSSVKQVIANCTMDKLDIDTLSITDLEYLFINIRAKSVGETANPSIKCENCKASVAISVDLTEVKIDTTKAIDRKIQLTQSVGVVMRYPTYEMVQEVNNLSKSARERNFDVIARCIEKVYDERNVYNAKDFSEKDIMDFIDSLTQASFVKIAEFFERMPRMRQDVQYDCPSCKHRGTMTLAGLQDFFT